jgi:GNAT superfamily N-acetyltransferase
VIRALAWDTAFFGFPVGTVEGGAEAHELQAFRCVYWLTGTDDERPANLGFAKVDERITLESRAGSRQRPEYVADGLRALTRPGSKDVSTAFTSTVRTAHTDSRFFQDRRFPRERSADLFQRWLERDFAEHLAWTIDRAGEPAGYITLAVNADSTSIGLLGVVERHRGHGLAKALVSQALAHSAALNLSCRVVTQGCNAGALKVYTTMGFDVVRRQTWWHWWNQASALARPGSG